MEVSKMALKTGASPQPQQWLISGVFSKRLLHISRLCSKPEQVLVPERRLGSDSRQCPCVSASLLASQWSRSCLSKLFPSIVLYLAFYTCGKQTSGNSSNTLNPPLFFFSLENSFCSVPLLLFSLERGPRWKLSDLTLFPKLEGTRTWQRSQGDVSVHDRGKEQLGPDVAPGRVPGYWSQD